MPEDLEPRVTSPRTGESFTYAELATASEQGNVEAICLWGQLQADVALDYEMAFKLFDIAAERGHVYALYRLGEMLLSGIGCPADEAAGVGCINSAAVKGDAAAQFRMGVFRFDGQYFQRDYGRAVDWFRHSAAGGSKLAQHRLGCCYAFGTGVERDDLAAIELFRAAAPYETDSQAALGRMYWYGFGVERDRTEALKHFHSAGTKGQKVALWFLGVAYFEGQEIEKNDTLAIQCLRRSAEQGYEDSYDLLGKLLVNSGNSLELINEGKAWLKKAAEVVD